MLNLLYLIILAPVIGAVSCYLKLRNEARIETQIYNNQDVVDDLLRAEIVVGNQGNDNNLNLSQYLAPIDEGNLNQSQDSTSSSSKTAEWVSFGGDEEPEVTRVFPNPDPSSLSRSNSSLSLASRVFSKDL